MTYRYRVTLEGIKGFFRVYLVNSSNTLYTGNKAVDEVSLAETVNAGIVKFQYFYDVVSKKSVIVTFEGEEPGREVQLPEIVETKGPLPIEFEHGYVAFEDLPDNRRRLPGEKKEGNGLLAMLGLEDEDEDDDEDLDDEDDDDSEDDLEEEDVIYDENE